MNDSELIYREHEKIGFPPIEKSKQAQMAIRGDVSILNELTPGFQASYIPYDLYNKYITLTDEEFRAYFPLDEYVQTLAKLHQEFPKQDSAWYEANKRGGFTLYVQERGGFVHREDYQDKEEMTRSIIRGFLGRLGVNNNDHK